MIASRTRGALILALAAAGAGCGVRSTTTDVSPGITRAPTCEQAIVTYRSRAEVPNDYYELAYIAAEGNSVYTTDGQILATVRKRAAEVGANAIIANPVQESKVTVKVLGEAVGMQSAESKASALAIWMPAQEARVRQQCGTGN